MKKIWGELRIDEWGKAHLDCHIHSSVTFAEAREALEKWIVLLQDTIDRRKECPKCNEGEAHIHAAAR